MRTSNDRALRLAQPPMLKLSPRQLLRASLPDILYCATESHVQPMLYPAPAKPHSPSPSRLIPHPCPAHTWLRRCADTPFGSAPSARSPADSCTALSMHHTMSVMLTSGIATSQPGARHCGCAACRCPRRDFCHKGMRSAGPMPTSATAPPTSVISRPPTRTNTRHSCSADDSSKHPVNPRPRSRPVSGPRGPNPGRLAR